MTVPVHARQCSEALVLPVEREANPVVSTVSAVNIRDFSVPGTMTMSTSLPTALTVASTVWPMVILLGVRRGHDECHCDCNHSAEEGCWMGPHF